MPRLAVVIGGTGFIGSFVARALDRMGRRVAVFHRGRTGGGLPDSVEHIEGERGAPEAGVRWRPEVVVDMILSSGRQAVGVIEAFRGVARRVVAVSSMDVYRACGSPRHRARRTRPRPAHRGCAAAHRAAPIPGGGD